MQKSSIRVSILSSIAFISIAILFVFGLIKINNVKAENNMGAMTAVVITVDNATNSYISERPITNLSSEDTPIMLDSYTELVGAKIENGKLFLKGATDGINPKTDDEDHELTPQRFDVTFTQTAESGEDVTTNGVAYYSEYLKKIIWFKTQKLQIRLTDLTSSEFTYTYEGQELTASGAIVQTEGGTTENVVLNLGARLGEITGDVVTKFESGVPVGIWTSQKAFETHEALLIRIGSKNSSIRYDIDAQTMTLNEETIDGFGKIEKTGGTGSYYYKEYHAIPAAIADECGINAAAKTKKVYGSSASSNYLNSLEGYYSLNITYRIETGSTQNSNFNFYLITSNTYANTDEILSFYNTNSMQVSSGDESGYSKLHYFNHNNLESSQLLNSQNAIELDPRLVTQVNSSTGLTYNGTTYPSMQLKGNIVKDVYSAITDNDGNPIGLYEKTTTPSTREKYIGFYVIHESTYVFVNSTNALTLPIIPGETPAYTSRQGIIYKDNSTQNWMFTDRLLYPTITFNPEKYDLKYNKVWYNLSESGEFEFETQNNLYGVMKVYVTPQGGTKTLTNTFDVARKTDALFGVSYQDEDLELSNNNLVSVIFRPLDGKISVGSTKYKLSGNTIVTDDESETSLQATYTVLKDSENTFVGIKINAENGLITINDTQYYYNKVDQKVCKYNLDAPFIAKYTFEELGEYEFMQQYKLKISDNNYYITNSINASTNISDKNEKLTISGYQATYRQNGTTTSYLRNENYVSDFSYLLHSPVYAKTNISSAISWPQDDSYVSYSEVEGKYIINIKQSSPDDGINYYIDAAKITSTNQAPVALRYFATPNSGAVNGKSLLWYVHISPNKQIAIDSYTNSKSFSAAGLYVIFLSFVDNSNSNNYCQQLIAFKITNSQPEISIETTELDNITTLTEKGNNPIVSNSFTNKNVYIQWLNNDVFNANIYATYNQYDFAGNVIKRSATLTGLVYFKDGSIKNNNTTLFKDNGRYVVNIFYTNTGSSISRSFVIDRTSISGIKALQVNNDGTIFVNEKNETLAGATLSDQTNFNLVVNKAFAWTWDKKESGANIYAKYYYSNIAGKSAYNLESINSDGEQWVLANGEFGEILTGTNYAHTSISAISNSDSDATYWKNASFESSQMITTNCLAILVLTDEAGNTASFVTIYDSITPQMIQQKAGSNEQTTSSLISSTTQFVWGSHKALSVKTNSGSLRINNVFADVFDGSSQDITLGSSTFTLSTNVCEQLRNSFKTYESSLYYTLPITRTELFMSNSAEISPIVPTKVGLSWTRTSCYVVVKENDGIFYTYLSNTENGSPISSQISLGDFPQVQVLLTTSDKMENKTTLNKYVSLDQSDGRMFSHSGVVDTSAITDTTKDSDTKSANRQQILEGYSTNRDFLTFSFLQQDSGNFRVKTIELEYYAINLGLTTIQDGDNSVPNTNYPYNPSPISYTLYSIDSSTQIMKNITWSPTLGDSTGYSGTYIQSSPINIASNGFTAPGKYVFIRTYATDISSMSTDVNKGDKTRFEYTVYVDRNGVISDDMKINIGTKNFGNYDENETYKEFGLSKISQKKAPTDFQENFTYNASTLRNIYFSQSKTNLSTDMLPANIALKLIDNKIASKYYFTYDGTDYYSSQENYNLMVIVQQFNKDNGIESQTLYSSYVTQINNPSRLQRSAPINTLSSQSFQDAAIYRVFVMDLSNINMPLMNSFFSSNWAQNALSLWDTSIYNSSFTPNVGTFSFKLRKEDIVSSAIIKNTNVDTYTNITTSSIDGTTYYYTQNNNVIFTFSDSIDEYKAKVQYKNWTLTRTLKTLENGVMTTRIDSQVTPFGTDIRTYDQNDEDANSLIFSENEIKRIKGNLDNPLSTMVFSTKDEEGGILYYRVKYAGISDNRYTYYIILPSSQVSEQKSDCIYTLNLSYVGNHESYYGFDSDGNEKDYYSTYVQSYIDNTAPYKNICDLIQKDTYLTNEQRQNMIANLNNPNHEFMQYYAFAVGTSYTPTRYDDSENIGYYYFKKVEQKYDDTQNPNQVAIPESDNYNKYTNNRFSENLNKKYYGDSVTASGDGSGYYDIIEVDKAGNHRVYTIYVNGSDGGVELNALTTDENSVSYDYSFNSSFEGSTPLYKITYKSNDVTKEIYSKSGEIDVVPSISASTFLINNLSIKDEWYTINYRLINGANSADWQTLVAAPQIFSNITKINYNTKAQNLEILNNFLSYTIENAKLRSGAKVEIKIVNRGGIDLQFYLLSPGLDLSISDLSPTLVGNRYFTITIPADTYSTKFSDFKVTQNSIMLVSDHNSPPTTIQSIKNNRSSPVMLRFALGNYRYSISFKDNFGRSYEFIYPTTEGIVNNLEFEEGTEPKYIDGVLYSSNAATFSYTTGTRDRISIKIVDKDTNKTIVNLQNLPYTTSFDEDSLKEELLKNENKMFMTESLNMTSSVVSINFNAIKNRHLFYEITLLDIDNNIHTRSFAIYTYAPTISLCDTVGIEIFNEDTVDKITSKTVVVRYSLNENFLFNPQVKLFDGTNSIDLASSAQIKNAGDYKLYVQNELGTINTFEINFTIKPATTDIYSVYFGDEILSAHTIKYSYEKDSVTRLIDSFYFLSGSNNAWADIRILPSEDKELITELVATSGNTKIYKIYGSVYEDYFAVTQIYPASNNHLTTFNVYTTTDLTSFMNSSVGSGDHQYTIEPISGKATYAQLHWDTSEAGVKNFVYANIWYNTVFMGKYTDDVILTKSGQYRIQIMDFVGQQHRFGSQNKEEFTLTILNNINYYINGESAIENQTFNDNVTLSLMNTDKYAWRSGGFIKVLRNNQDYSNYETNGTSWIFKDAGYYSVYIETPISSNTATPITISATAHFTILDKNESKTVYDFAKISGYSVTRVEKINYNSDLSDLLNLILTNYTSIDEDSSYSEQVLNSFKQYNENIITQNNITNVTQLAEYLKSIDINSLLYTYTDMTASLKALYDTEALQSFKITTDNLGVGRYKIYVKVNSIELMTTLNYSYEIWINDEQPTITPSRAYGSSSTKNFSISYNPSIIYSQIGNSYIMINNTLVETINENSQTQNEIKTFRVTAPGTYLIQVYSSSGSLISSQRITINVPLNTAAILLIVGAVLVVVGVVVIFILFRTKMKVK